METVSAQVQSQSLNAVVAGFSFAAAISWMEVVRYVLTKVVKTPGDGGISILLTALLTTLLSVLVYMILSRLSRGVVQPGAVVYAVSGAR
jgi:hypothetical protein